MTEITNKIGIIQRSNIRKYGYGGRRIIRFVSSVLNQDDENLNHSRRIKIGPLQLLALITDIFHALRHNFFDPQILCFRLTHQMAAHTSREDHFFSKLVF